jgi:hypothetical protein
MALADLSDTYRPLEGALTLLLLRLIEEHHFQAIADFNDRSTPLGSRNRHFLFGALQHLDARALTRPEGILDVVLKEISPNDLELMQELGLALSRRGQYHEVDALYGLLLDRSFYADQLLAFPQHLTKLLLERADNKRRSLAKESGGRIPQSAYKEGRKPYEEALARIDNQKDAPAQRSLILRFLGLYELDTNHLDEAEHSFQEGWLLTQDTSPALEALEERRPHRAWLRHLQSAVKRRKVETRSLETTEKWTLLQQAREIGEEALSLTLQHRSPEKTELLAQAYDNLARILVSLASQEIAQLANQASPSPQDEKNNRLALLHQANAYFDGSLQAKRALHDFLGMAMSFAGLGHARMEAARLCATDGLPHLPDWQAARESFLQALHLNRDILRSGFGIALSYQSLADISLLHPDHHGEGISYLVEALIAFAKIGATQACQDLLQRLVKELLSLPLNDTRRLLSTIVEQIRRVHEISDWLLKALWQELSSALGEKIPSVFRDIFRRFFS